MNSLETESKETKFLAVWDMLGLEYLADLTAWEKDQMWAKLTEENPKIKLPSLQSLLLRARFNSQRHYEIYVFTTTDLTEADIRYAFEIDPQSIVDLIREKGEVIFSDRTTKDRVIV